MRWEAWVLIVMFAVNALIAVAKIGTTRLYTPSYAVCSMLELGGYTWLVLRLAGVA